MRRWLGIIALLFFSFTLVGVHPMHWALRQMAREDMKALIRTRGIGDEGLARLSFRCVNGEVADARFEWEEKGEEFELDGAMYDVVAQAVEGGLITFTCIADLKETGLVTMANSIASIGGTMGNSRGTARSLVKFITERYLCQALSAQNIHPSVEVNTPRIVASLLSSGFPDHSAPPPRG